MSPLARVLKFDPSGKLVHELRRRHVRVPARHPRRSRRQRLGDRRQRQPAAPRAPGQPADAPLPPMPAKVVGHQVFKFSPDGKLLLTLGKPGGNQPGQPRRSGVVLPAQRRHHLSERRHPGRRGPRQRGAGDGAPDPLRQDRQVHHASSARWAPASRASSCSRTASRSIRAAACSSPIASNNRIQILDAETLQDARHVVSVQPPERDLHRQERHDLRRRLGVGLGQPAARRLEARHPHRQRARTARSPRSFPIRRTTA